MPETPLRAQKSEISGQLYQHLGPSVTKKDSLGRMSVTVTIVGAVQSHEEVICWGRSQGQKRLPLFNSDGTHQNDKTKPAQKPDAKV